MHSKKKWNNTDSRQYLLTHRPSSSAYFFSFSLGWFAFGCFFLSSPTNSDHRLETDGMRKNGLWMLNGLWVLR